MGRQVDKKQGEAKTRTRRLRRARPEPTPIPLSQRSWIILGLVGFLVLALFLYLAPSVLIIAVGGAALAIVLSFPVHALSRFMPRGLAILATLMFVVAVIVLSVTYLVPILVEQLSAFVAAVPAIARSAEQLLLGLLEPLASRGLLQGTPEEFISRLGENLFGRLQTLAESLLTGVVGFISGAFNFAVNLFGILFVAIYLLVDVRKVEAAYLRLAPRRYRRDARELWHTFRVSLGHYLGGLIFVIAIQGVLAGVSLYFLGVPYALLLGAWVSVTAIIPYLGAFLGAIPAVTLALLFESPTVAILTVIVYVAIQQLEGNLLTPYIQGQALRVHPIIVLLAVIGGGAIAGIAGVIFAVPALAIVRVLLDFFRARLTVAAGKLPED